MPTCGRCGTAANFWGSLTFNAQSNRCRRCEDEVKRLFYPAQAAFQSGLSFLPPARIAQMHQLLLQNKAPFGDAARYLGADVDRYLCHLLDGSFGKIEHFVVYIRQLRQQLGLTNMPGPFYERFVANTHRFGDLETLPLTPRQCTLYLDPGEECYLAAYRSDHLRPSQTGTKVLPGDLIFTDRRIIFAAHGSTGAHEIPWRRVHAVRVQQQRLLLDVSVKRASWQGPDTSERQYTVAEPLILATLAEKIRTQRVPNTPRSRHIPENVREAVYRRDGGCCVLCGSTIDIHYDHIIPFSKGGANTIENIRVLCQHCNLSRGNRIGD